VAEVKSFNCLYGSVIVCCVKKVMNFRIARF